MKQILAIYLVVLAVTIIGCNQVDAPKGVNPDPYLGVLEEGLTKRHDYLTWPQGQITIMSQLSSRMEAPDLKSMRLPYQYLKNLKNAEKDGLLSMKEKKQSSIGMFGNQGARIFTVTLNEKLRKLADLKNSNDKFLAVQIGTMKVLEIIKEEPCKLKRGKPGDEFRLVVGLMRDVPTQEAKILGPKYATVEPQKLKFRAILQFNPFNKSYTYYISDVGKPSETKWASDLVAQIIKD